MEFYDPKPIISPFEQARTWEKQLELGLTTREDILIEMNPDLTRQEAEQRLEETQIISRGKIVPPGL